MNKLREDMVNAIKSSFIKIEDTGITTAKGDALTALGENIGFRRNAFESDEGYRTRLMAILTYKHKSGYKQEVFGERVDDEEVSE